MESRHCMGEKKRFICYWKRNENATGLRGDFTKQIKTDIKRNTWRNLGKNVKYGLKIQVNKSSNYSTRKFWKVVICWKEELSHPCTTCGSYVRKCPQSVITVCIPYENQSLCTMLLNDYLISNQLLARLIHTQLMQSWTPSIQRLVSCIAQTAIPSNTESYGCQVVSTDNIT